MPCSDEFVNGEMDDGEHISRYCPGGVYLVHIGDRLDGDRDKVVKPEFKNEKSDQSIGGQNSEREKLLHFLKMMT